MDVTIEYFKHEGNVPTEMALLNLQHKGEEIQGELIFNTAVKISSLAIYEFFGYKEEITF